MSAFDLWLYVSFGLGLLLGLAVRWRSPWVGHATLAVVFVLILLLGTTLSETPGGELLRTIPLALAFTVLLLVITVLLVRLLPHGEVASPRAPDGQRRGFVVGAVLIAALLVGFGVGRLVVLPGDTLLTYTLYVLLALVAFNLKLSRSGLRNVWVPLLAAVLGALAAAAIFTFVSGVGPRETFSTALAFGWYSLAGPLVAARVGPALGLFAFLTNFLRENITMVTAPVLGPRIGGEGVTAMGGATSMDTTLYFVTRYGDPDGGSLALASGFLLTITASLLLPLLLNAPWP